MFDRMCIYTRYLIWIVAILIQFGKSSMATNCAEPPKLLAPQECCRFPQLFKQNAFDHCKDTLSKGNQCFYECVYAATELCRRGECDYRKAEDYVDWVMPDEHDFKTVYKKAYKGCMNEATNKEKKNVQHKHYECDTKPELIELCVQNKMFSLCPTEYFNWNKTECTQERDFLENCILDV